MKIKNLFWLFTGLIMITGCGVHSDLPDYVGVTETAASAHSTIIPPVATTPTPVRVAAATITSTQAATKSLTPGKALSPTPVPMLHKQCLQVLPAIPERNTVEGKIVLSGDVVKIQRKGENLKIYYQRYFYDLRTRQTSFLSGYQPAQLFVSPDREKYAINDAQDDHIKVFSADGRLLQIIPEGKYPWGIGGWVDDQTLELVIAQGFSGLNPNDIKYPRDVVLVNLVTGKQQYLPSDYPNIEKANIFGWDGPATTSFDRTLTRVIYPAVIQSDYRSEGGQGYTLWDLVNKKKLTEVVNNGFQVPPKWAPDGSKIVISGQNYDLFTITRDGRIQQLTYLNPEILSGTLSEWYQPVEFSWSPDGQLLAFWLVLNNSNGSSQASLVTLDMQSGEITDTCVSAGSIDRINAYFPLSTAFTPVWSPDGNYLVVIANGRDDGSFDTLLIDLKGGNLMKIGNNLDPDGWLVSDD